jgi:Domain of unknown function (DUF151)
MLGRRISAEILRDAGLVYRATPEVLARAAISPRAGVAMTGGTYSVRFEAHPSVRRTRDEARRNPVNKGHHGHDGRPDRTSILEIGIGQPEAMAIGPALQRARQPRPMTHDLIGLSALE